METLYRARNWVATGPSLLLFLAVVLLTLNTAPKPPKPKPHPPMRVTLAAPPVEQPTPPEPQPMPQLAPLEPVTPDISLPAMPKLSPRPTQHPVPATQPQATQTAPSQTTQATAAPSAPSAPATPAPPAPMRPASATADDAYAARVRGYLDSIKHYPTSKEARLQRPRGTVEVWVVIERGGGMKEAGIETSSGSLILDGAALQLVRGASYPAFPPDAFNGEATHRFTVQIAYSLSS
jgi:protein TonB